jgi:predicted nucleic acid-binding protein
MAKIDAIADTGYLYALYNVSEPEHDLCIVAAQWYPNVLIPDVVLTEVAFLFNRFGQARAVAGFIHDLEASNPRLVRATRRDLQRAADLLETYYRRGTNLDFIDCCVTAIAERYNVEAVLTFDYRDFSIIRPKHVSHLTLLPD